jgi:hypothetical protein
LRRLFPFRLPASAPRRLRRFGRRLPALPAAPARMAGSDTQRRHRVGAVGPCQGSAPLISKKR